MGVKVTHITNYPIYPVTIPVSTQMPLRFNWAASWPHNSGPLLLVLLLGHPRKLSDDPLPWAPPGSSPSRAPSPAPPAPAHPLALVLSPALGAGWGELEARAGGAVLLFIAFVPLALLCWI